MLKNLKKGNEMKLKLLTAALLFAMIAGCSTVVPVNSTLPVTVTLSASDLKIGDKITHTIPYNKKDPHIYAKVYREALVKSGYDFVLLPQYEIRDSLFKSTITIIGYGAYVKR